MDDPRAQRTLVKSPPELWAEISDAGALAGHLGAFGEIRISRLEHETTVAWEGDRARGTVELEPSGWGTKVTLTACIAAETAAAEPGPEATEEPEAAGAPEPAARAPEAPGAPEPAAPEVEPQAAAPGPVAVEPEAPRLRPRRRWWPFGRRRAGACPPAPEPPSRERPDPEDEAPPPPQPPAATAEPAPEPESGPGPQAASVPEMAPAALDATRAEEILSGVLDDLGAARHRPFSRG
jgi:hypothetical protein